LGKQQRAKKKRQEQRRELQQLSELKFLLNRSAPPPLTELGAYKPDPNEEIQFLEETGKLSDPLERAADVGYFERDRQLELAFRRRAQRNQLLPLRDVFLHLNNAIDNWLCSRTQTLRRLPPDEVRFFIECLNTFVEDQGLAPAICRRCLLPPGKSVAWVEDQIWQWRDRIEERIRGITADQQRDRGREMAQHRHSTNQLAAILRDLYKESGLPSFAALQRNLERFTGLKIPLARLYSHHRTDGGARRPEPEFLRQGYLCFYTEFLHREIPELTPFLDN
jgi:hypothetical protein